MKVSNSRVQYEHIVISGLPAARGHQYGRQAAEKIRKNIAHYLEPGQLPPWDQVTRYIHSIYIPGLQKFFPSALEEMKGIAAGAGVSLEQIVMVNARYDLARAPGGSRHRPRPKAGPTASGLEPRDDHSQAPARQHRQDIPPVRSDDAAPEPGSNFDDCDECTSSAFLSGTTTDGNVICAQNWDISSYLYTDDIALLLEIHPDPSEGKPSMFVLTEAGQMGRSGMNSAGLGLCANALTSSNDYFPDLDSSSSSTSQFPCLPNALLRRLYLESSTFPKAIQAVCNTPRHVSGNLTVATAEGFAMCLELTPHDVFLLEPEKDERFLVHSNHYLHPAVKARPRSDLYDAYPGGSSWFRHARLREGVKPHLGGGINSDTLKSAFSDHLGYPQSLCQHVDKSPGTGLPGYPFKGSMTVGCVIYDLTRRVITTCKGTPCKGVFETYKLDDQ